MLLLLLLLLLQLSLINSSTSANSLRIEETIIEETIIELGAGAGVAVLNCGVHTLDPKGWQLYLINFI